MAGRHGPPPRSANASTAVTAGSKSNASAARPREPAARRSCRKGRDAPRGVVLFRTGIVYAECARIKQQGPKENGSSAGARWGRQFRSKCTGAARCTFLNRPACRRFLTHFNKCGRDAKPGCYAGRSQVFFKCCNASCYSKDGRPVCAKGNTAICCGMKSIAMRQETPALQWLLSASRHRNEAGDLGIIRSEKSEVCHEANARRRRTSPTRRH